MWYYLRTERLWEYMREKVCALALSPAIDKTIYVDDFALNGVNHALKTLEVPGAKGVNVAKNLARCGLDSVCFGFIGGKNGEFICSELQKDGVECDFVKVDYDARTNIKIVDLKNSTYTDVNLLGNSPTKENIEMLKIKTKELAKKCSVVALGGSLPPGVDASLYYELAKIAKAEGALVTIDSCKEPLKVAIKANPFAIKPNIDELEGTFGEKYNTTDEIINKAMSIYESGVSNVLISLGSEGAVAVCGGDVFRLYTLDVPVYNTVGAGDAFLSGFIYGIQKELGIVEALRHSASFSQAVVSSYAGDVTELSQFKKYIDSVRVESVYTKGGARV
ncbi:MAG: 1-phosphofructokinase family hexose kinase [Ruminococcaceae bacterium]|nr:1-phosphofructokinase family hexose kinase [Oscillospiraceae bacterium]